MDSFNADNESDSLGAVELIRRDLEDLNRVYATLSNVNQAIIRVRDRDRLFREVCRIAVEDGCFRMAWIGMVDEERRSIRIETHFGDSDGYLEQLVISLDDEPFGRGPSGRAFRERTYQVCNDVAHDEMMIPWREEALRRNFCSVAAFPMTVSGRLAGVFTLYSQETGFFNDQRIRLLAELADDVAFALETIEGEERRLAAEREILARNRELTILHRISEIFLESRSMDEAFRVIVEEVSAGTGFPVVMVEFLDAARRKVVCRGVAGIELPPEGVPFELDMEKSLSGPVMESGRTLVTTDARMLPAFREGPLGKTGIRTLICVPLVMNGTVGALSVASGEEKEVEERLIKWLVSLANYTAALTRHERVREELGVLNEDLERRVLDRTAQLELMNRELEAFGYSVSHDLRAPLRHIEGYSRVLAEDFGDILGDDGRRYLQRICYATHRMEELIDALLRLARVSREEPACRAVDMTALCLEVAAELGEGGPDRHVSFVIAPGMKAWGDRHLLGVVLRNLMGNSWKYTARREEAVIEAGMTSCCGERVFFVRDNGVGFDRVYSDRLFGVFQRLHTEEEFEGTGIGLATVQRIIHRHGGRVWAEGEVGVGATFYFTLPPERGGREEN